MAQSLKNLAEHYSTQGKYAEAEPLYKQALSIIEKSLGGNNPIAEIMLEITLENMSELYKKMGNEKEAEKLEERAKKIRSANK